MAKRKRRKPRGRALPNPRHEAFCSFFVFGDPHHDPKAAKDDRDNPPETQHNATISYMAAGYKANYRAAAVSASRLLRKANILARITELRKDEQNIRTAFLQHWKTLLPDAQAVLRQALAGEDISPQAIQAAREIIEQAQGPTRFRFGIDKGPDVDGGLNITLWSGRKE